METPELVVAEQRDSRGRSTNRSQISESSSLPSQTRRSFSRLTEPKTSTFFAITELAKASVPDALTQPSLELLSEQKQALLKRLFVASGCGGEGGGRQNGSCNVVLLFSCCFRLAMASAACQRRCRSPCWFYRPQALSHQLRHSFEYSRKPDSQVVYDLIGATAQRSDPGPGFDMGILR